MAADLFERNKIVHRDLKPDNILLFKVKNERFDLVIADLGHAVYIEDCKPSLGLGGSPGYVGPEVLRGNRASYKSDVYSIGCIIFKLLSSMPLFYSRYVEKIMQLN